MFRIATRDPAVKALTTLLGVAAILVALLTAPLFHFHNEDDHGKPVSVVHAHFLDEPEAQEHHSGAEFEDTHSHSRARWIEFFTFSHPLQAFDGTIDLTETFSVALAEEREGIVISAVPRAHGPPDARRFAPRSPPTI